MQLQIPEITTEKSQTQLTNSHSKTLIGIDPATEGAAVVYKNEQVAVCFLWRRATRKKVKCFVIHTWDINKDAPTKNYVRAISDIGFFISEHPAVNDGSQVHFSCEDTHYANARSTIIVSRIGGAIVAPLEHKFQRDVVYVKANIWRHKVLGMKHFSKRKQAKETSLKMIPSLLKNLDDVILSLGRYDHITDAGGILLYLKQQL